jgi:hypothetical protein
MRRKDFGHATAAFYDRPVNFSTLGRSDLYSTCLHSFYLIFDGSDLRSTLLQAIFNAAMYNLHRLSKFYVNFEVLGHTSDGQYNHEDV